VTVVEANFLGENVEGKFQEYPVERGQNSHLLNWHQTATFFGVEKAQVRQRNGDHNLVEEHLQHRL
jgi:hypothetical protein